MKYSALYSFLNELVDDCKYKFKTLNAGGCGALAKFIADELDNIGIKYHFCISNPCKVRKTNRSDETYIERVYSKDLSIYYVLGDHVFISINKFDINAGNCHACLRINRRLNKKYKQNLEDTFVFDVNANRYRKIWNENFSSSDIILLQKFVHKKFKEFRLF